MIGPRLADLIVGLIALVWSAVCWLGGMEGETIAALPAGLATA